MICFLNCLTEALVILDLIIGEAIFRHSYSVVTIVKERFVFFLIPWLWN